MKEREFVRLFAGTVITLAFLGGWLVSDWIYLFVLFAGLNLIQSSFTGFCPPEKIYNKVLN